MKRKNKFNEFLEMPREIDSKEPKVTIISFDEIYIENYKGILEYEEFFIKINTEIGTISVNGFNLTLQEITSDDIGVNRFLFQKLVQILIDDILSRRAVRDDVEHQLDFLGSVRYARFRRTGIPCGLCCRSRGRAAACQHADSHGADQTGG